MRPRGGGQITTTFDTRHDAKHPKAVILEPRLSLAFPSTYRCNSFNVSDVGAHESIDNHKNSSLHI